jgi:ribosomal protein S18 acetylase RimI-like enzyme
MVTTLRARPMTTEEFSVYRDRMIAEYAAERTHADATSLEEATAAARAETDEMLPDGPQTKGMRVLVAELTDGDRIGVLWVGLRKPDGSQAWIYDIEVDADRRGRGLGRELLALAESEARDLGATDLGLNVFAFNTVAQRLYETAGYETTAMQMRKPL